MNTDEGSRFDLAIGGKVFAEESLCGKSVALVLNPVKDEITDVAVQLNGMSKRKVLVPVEHIRRSSEDGIWFDIPCEEVEGMPDFLKTEFVEREVQRDFPSQVMVMWPYVTSELKNIPVEVESIPADELAVHVGADVISLDGKVGKVDEFLINPENDRISHLVLREGHLWGKNDVVIPVSAIRDMDEHTVWVDLDKQQIEALPELPVHRSEKWFSND
jgi:uncharacterized protein YrrD